MKIFEKFPEWPLMTRLHKIPSDYWNAKLLDSVVYKFVYDTSNAISGDECDVGSVNGQMNAWL